MSGPIISNAFSQPLTNVPVLQLFKGFTRADTANSIFIKEVVRQPGIWRFIRFWLSPFSPSPASLTKDILELQGKNTELIRDLIKEGVLSPQVLTPQTFIELSYLNSIDIKQEFTKYCETNKETLSLLQKTPFSSQSELNSQLFSKLPTFKGLASKYNMALKS